LFGRGGAEREEPTHNLIGRLGLLRRQVETIDSNPL
jgi:hypothetical protein